MKEDDPQSIIQKAVSVKEEIHKFRVRLAYNRATEFLESRFGWTKIFDMLEVALTKLIDEPKR